MKDTFRDWLIKEFADFEHGYNSDPDDPYLADTILSELKRRRPKENNVSKVNTYEQDEIFQTGYSLGLAAWDKALGLNQELQSHE